jgi:anhydro-N-acetylmuramic acid kinase
MDAALVRFTGPTHADLVAFISVPYQAADRRALENATNGASTPDLARLHVRIGHLAAAACQQLLERAHVPASDLDFIAFPGQTIWHEPPTVSWQLGDAAVVAESFGVRVVHDFRSRDVAAGGEGAPLVPMADVLLYGHPDRGRVLVNIGGMANLTYVPRAADDVGALAFDTGPGMALTDALSRLVDPALGFDRDGAISIRGTCDRALLDELLQDEYFERPPPKSTGRERFGAAMVERVARKAPGPDGVATAVALTVESVARSVERWVPSPVPEVVVSGGGRLHPGILSGLRDRLAANATEVALFDDRFYDGDAKEAVAFALLGYLTVHGQPGNVPAATGARGARVLGSVTPP